MNGNVNRRKMMKGTLMFAGCLTFSDLKEAMAQARKTGKPVLTDRNFNAFIIKSAQVVGDRKAGKIRLQFRDWKNYEKVAQEAQKDFPQFLYRHFTVTAKQRLALQSLKLEELAVIGRTISHSIRTKQIVFMRFESARSPAKSGFDSRAGTGVLYFGDAKGAWEVYKAVWKSIKEAVDWAIDQIDEWLDDTPPSGGADTALTGADDDDSPEHLIPNSKP